MANLLSNTTIGGYQSIHTGNIGSYAITSLSGYATQSWVQSQAYITSSNNYYYVNPGNGYGIGFWGNAPTTYGITMANESAGYGVIYGLSEYHLYFSMTGGGNRGFVFRNDAHGAVTQIGAYGWQMWRGELYPGYNNATSGSQTSYYIYGNTNNSGLRTNGNWLVNGNLYIGSRDVWFSDWFNQDVRDSAGPTFAQVYSSGWFRNYGTQGLYNQSYGTHFYSLGASSWGITGSGGAVELQFRSNHQSTIRGYVYANTSNEIGFLSEDGNWVLRTWNRGVQAYGSMRSPIYYDSDDTSYYADFASTSDSAVRVRGGALFGPNPTWGAYLQVGGNGNNSGSYASVVTTNGNLHLDATNGSSTYINHYYGSKIHFGSGGAGGGTYIHSNFSADGYLNLGGGSGNASYRLQVSGTGYATGDFRAPIFYDSDNTSYYVDPNGISNIWRLYANGKYNYFGSSSNWDDGNLNGENSNITNVHFQGHPDFWIGAGNTKWYTSVASGHHDLLINTMQSGGSNVRGITFTASSSGGSVYRLGRWFAHSTQAGSYLNVDGSIKIGGTSDTYSPPAAKLQVISSTSGSDVLAVDGVNGRLFTVTDDLSDSLFSVNTIAGLPVIEAFADNTVKIGKYGSNSITISGSKIAINSDSVDANFPFFVGDRSIAGARYSLTNKGMGFNLADNYAQLQLYGGAGAYIDFTTSSGQDSAGRIMWDGNFNIQGTTYFANNIYTYTLFDRNDTGYYLDMNGTSRLGTLNINQLSVYGNTYLGDGNGDEVHINDILRVGATDSGDAHFYFGEGGSAGSDYGSHWYWDSGYTFTWYTRNAGTDTALFDYVTNDTTYVNWRRHFNMQSNFVNYTGQLHFSGGTRFVAGDSNYLTFKTDSTSYGGIVVKDGSNGTKGYSAYYDSNGFGLLNSGGSWGIRLSPGNSDTVIYHAGNWKLSTISTGISVNGNVYTNQNYGDGLVGVYASDRYQGVFAMGDSYKLATNGTSPGSLYGIAWTHTNVGGESKSGLGHQALFMTNGNTQTAIGTGIWTAGLITTTSYGTSANWNTAFGWGNHASVGYLTSLPSHNHDDRYYTESEIDSQIGTRLYQSSGVVIDVNAFNSTGLYRGSTGSWTNRPTITDNSGALLQIDTHPGNYHTQLFFDSSGTRLYLRSAIAGSWNSWVTMLHSGNYTSYSPSLTGSGASGTWGINITGTAESIASNPNRTDGTAYPVVWSNGGSYSPNYSCAAVTIQSSTGTLKATYVNAPSGYVSNGNPWGTANSAYFPNGITTAGNDNWVYGHTYVGNAPSNGSGHEFWTDGSEYHRSNVGTASHGQSGKWITRQSANGNYAPYSFESDYGNHSYGVIARYHISNNGGTDRPSIMFSSGYTNTRWNVGYCYTDDQFRITQNMALAPDGSDGTWGTERFKIDTSGNTYAAIGGTLYANGSAVISSANIGSQSVSYATTSGALTSMNISQFTNNSGYLTSLPSHNHDDRYYTETESDNRYVQYGSLSSSFGLNDNKLYLRTNTDNNHYIWNAADDWEEIVAYSGTGLRIASSTGVTLATFTTGGNSLNITGNAATATYATTAGSAPANGGNSSTVGGYSVSVGASANTIPTRNASGYFIPESWIQLNGSYGLYSPTYNAHIRPNTATYGAWEMIGSKGSWAAIYFVDSGNYLMANNNEVGHYQDGLGWKYRWYQGTMYISRSTTGGGTEYTALDSGNYSSWAQPIASAINTGNIGSQSVSYAATAGSTDNIDGWGFVNTGSNNGTNADTINSNGISYYTGGVTNFSGNSTDGALYSQRYSDSWQHQIAGDYRSGMIAVRGRNNGSWTSWRTIIDSSTISSQSVNYASSAGSVAWTNVSSRPTALSQFSNDLGNYGGWLTTGGKAADSELFDGTDSIYFVKGNGTNTLGYRTTNISGSANQGLSSGFYDGTGMTNMPTSDWYHLIVNAHYNSSTSNQYEFQLATAFWNKSDFFVRSISPGDVGPWRTLVHNGNIGSQSVSYASTSGSATTAGSATMAQQLSKFGDIYGQDWNSYYVSGKLIVANALGHSGANRPNLTYDYGVALSYGETGGPLLQMYFPENSGNIGTIFRKGTYRTGWNGNWSTWKTLVEQEGNTCTIVGGNGTGLEVHGNVGYNQDPLTYFLLRGQADSSWKALKIRLTGDAGGQDIEFRRIAENSTDARIFYVPRGANQVIFDYTVVQPSDSRLKDNLTSITTPVEKIKSLRGVEFDWNSGEHVGTHDVGLIAQDVEAVLPEAVTTQEDGYKNLAYTKVIPLLVEAMKEQQTMIEALRAEIELLKSK